MKRFFRWASNRLRNVSQSDARLGIADPGTRFGAQCEPAFFDLSEQQDLTFSLMDDTQVWRERAVHEILLRDSDHIDASVSYQIRVPLELVRRHEPTAQVGDRVRLLLPLAVRPKRLLFDVSIEGAEGSSASLILKRDAAPIQAEYMTHLDGRPLEERPLRGTLWAGVSAYTPWAWREHHVGFKRRARRPLWIVSRRAWRIEALARYLATDLGLDIEARHVAEWLRQTEDARIALINALGEGEDSESSSECILLAIPYMPYQPDRITDIDILVTEFCAAVKSMKRPALRALAELGRRWQLIVDTTVPAGRPCTVRLSEQRPWLNSPSPWLVEEIAISDAASTHVEIRAADHGVVLDRLHVNDFEDTPVDHWMSEDVRTTADAVALYADAHTAPLVVRELYADTRAAPGVVRVKLRARPRRAYRRPIRWLQLLIVMAGITMLSLPGTFSHLVESLALLTFPLTLAGAVVLTREATSLAERLLRRSRFILMTSIAALWAVALIRLMSDAEVGWIGSVWDWLRRVIF